MAKKQYAFYVNSAACSGCKTCQIACKDKHDLEVGRLWRRVYEVTGGDWLEKGEAWQSTVFAYNLSIACNHCQEPICVEVCPTTAMHKRNDGIVMVDTTKCVGCRYCEWACPYGAPQFNPMAGQMSKCHLCYDHLNQDLNPACVDACPMRVLDFGDLDELQVKYGDIDDIYGVAEVYPLPESKITNPSLILRPHKDAVAAKNESAEVANLEEV